MHTYELLDGDRTQPKPGGTYVRLNSKGCQWFDVFRIDIAQGVRQNGKPDIFFNFLRKDWNPGIYRSHHTRVR